MILEGKKPANRYKDIGSLSWGSLQVLARLNLMKLSSLLADKKMYTESLMADAQALFQDSAFLLVRLMTITF